MKTVEEVCDRFFKSEEDLERDLMLYLKYKESGTNPPQHIRGEYQDAVIWILEKCECLDDLSWRREINDKGKEFIKRGWVIRDYATPKRKEWWKITREWIALFVAIVIGLLGCFLPIKKTDQAIPELMEIMVESVKVISQQLDSITQIDQACKDTCNQNCQKNKN